MNVQIKKTITLLVIFMMVFIPIVQAMDIIIEDPKPDTTAPTLVAVEINEATVTPTQSQKFRIETTDDLSGVKTVAAVFRHDSGVTKYVSLQKKEGDFFEGLFSVDRYEKVGNWKLNTVELTDNKNNRTTYYSNDSNYSKTFDFSKNVFVVSGTEIRPPVVRPDDFEAPTLSTINVNTETGDFLVSPTMPLSVKVEATDNMLGVDRVYVSFTTPRGTSTTSYLTYKAATNSFEGSFYPNQFEELGTWRISSVYLSDGWNAKTVYNSLFYPTATEKIDMEVDSFKVINTTPDFSPPTLDGLERSLTQVSSKMAIYKLIATVNDNLSGVYSVSATYLKPDNSSFNLQFSRLSDGRYYAEIPIDQYDQLGKWTMRSMTLRDAKFNDITIYNSELNTYASNKRDFSPYNFTVRGLISLEPVVPFGIDSNYSQIEINPGGTQALTTYLNYSDGSKIDVSATKTGTIYSTNTEKLSVDETGVITASTDLAPGEYFIDVKYGAFYKRIKVLVPGEYEKGNQLIVSPSNLSLSKGASHQLNVSAEINGNLYDISGSGNGVTYVNEYPQLISIDSNGLIKNLTDAVLKTKIAVRYKDLTASIEINLTGTPSIEKIVSSPSEVELFKGGNIQLNSRALFSDGSSENISSSLNTTYTSSLTSRVTVSGTGLVTVPLDASYGYATVTVKNGSNFSKVLVKVIEDLSNVMSGIEVVGPDFTMYREDSYQLEVNGIYPTGQR
ncbi:Ig-like domain-containing protein, partial [Exiguobacterium sp. s141]|uniref:Ig-like domain-containing protein n=1 Tax=Exiguobacterium sp. s141 TaxID=2751240 RepID=UPI001BE966C2